MTKPQSEPDFTSEDRAVVESYLRDIDGQMRRQKSISVRYALGTGIFMVTAIWFDDARLAIPVYLVLLVWLVIRYRALDRRTRTLRRIFTSYESAVSQKTGN